MNDVTNVAAEITGLVVEHDLVGKKALLETPMVSENLFSIGHKGEPKEGIIVIDPITGVPAPVVEGEEQPAGKVLHLTSPLQYIGVLKDESAEFAMTVVSTSSHTYYHFIVKKAIFVIRVPSRSKSVSEATWNLFLSNLYNGADHFNRMANCYPRLFEALFKLSYQEPQELAISFSSASGVVVPSKLYLYPDNPGRNILSVGGMCLDIDMTVHPGKQIDRGVRGYRDPKVEEARVERQLQEKKLRNFLKGGGGTMVAKPAQKKKTARTQTGTARPPKVKEAVAK